MRLRSWWITICAIILLAGVPSLVFAQSVTRSNVLMRGEANDGERAAEEQGRNDWVDLRNEETGTRVVLSAGVNNADIVLLTNKSFGTEELLTECRVIADTMELPQTDFNLKTGKLAIYADMDLNDYLKKNGRDTAAIRFSLSDLRDALQESKLPRPITLFVETSKRDVTVATLVGGDGAREQITEKFFALSDIPDDMTIRFDTQIPWYGYVCAAGFLCLMVLPAILPWTLVKYHRAAREKERLAALAPTPEPETVQKQYNKQLPVLVSSFGFPLILMVLLFSGGFFKGITAATSILIAYHVPMMILPIGMMVGFMLSNGCAFLVNRYLDKKVVVPVDEDTAPTWTSSAILMPFPIAMFALMPLIAYPPLMLALRQIAPNAIWFYYGGVIAFAVGTSIGLGIYARRLTHFTLPEDHFARTIASDLAAQEKVQIRRFEVVRSKALNAYVTLWGTLGFTSRILREFSADELRVVIAHEIGHFRAADTRRQLLFGLLVTTAILGGWYLFAEWLRTLYTLSREARAFLNSPVFAMMFLPVLQMLFTGKARRNAEEAADRFAVDTVHGNGQFVIDTLTKLHTINQSPHTLKPSDEIISTHPSLTNRIANIRQYVAEKYPEQVL